MKSQLSHEKAASTSTSPITLEILRRCLGKLAGAGSGGIRNLGADFTGGQRLSKRYLRVRRERFRKLVVRGRRLRTLTKEVGGKASRLFVSGLLPSATYGDEVQGYTDAELKVLKTQAGAAQPPFSKGRSLEISLLLSDGGVARHAAPCLLRWAREVWDATTWPRAGTVVAKTLAFMWAKVVGEKVTWKNRRGPLGTAFLEVARLGWTFQSAWVVVTEVGREIDFREVGPKNVEEFIAQRFRDQLADVATTKLNDAGFKTNGRVSTEIVEKVINSKKTVHREKCLARSLACRAIWTPSRLAKAGYLVDTNCSLCGEPGDDLTHRLWKCEHGVELRKQFGMDKFVDEALGDNPPAWLHTGLVSDPGPRRPLPCEDGRVVFLNAAGQVDDNTLWKMWGTIFIDGSCYPAPFRSAWRAGWSAVMVDAVGTVLCSMFGPVWAGLPQTAPAAEWTAWSAVQQILVAPSWLYSDCRAVCLHAHGAARQAVMAKAGRMKAVTWLKAAQGEDGAPNHVEATIKTKAHVKDLEGLSEKEVWEAKANDRADFDAKRGAKLHPQPSTAERDEDAKLAVDVANFVKYAVKVLCLWPPLPKGLEKQVAAQPARAREPRLRRPKNGEGHLWTFALGRWCCQTCSATAFSVRRRRERDLEVCAGSAPQLRDVVANARGHKLAAADCDGCAFLFCTACGKYATKRARDLLAQCEVQPTAWGRWALSSIGKGYHPDPHLSPKPRLHVVMKLINGVCVGPADSEADVPSVSASISSASGSRLDEVRARIRARFRPAQVHTG